MRIWFHDNQIGILVTVIFHLSVFLLLTINSIRTHLSTVYYEVNVEQADEQSAEKEEAEKLAALEKEVEDMLISNRPAVSLANVAVNSAAAAGENMGSGGSQQLAVFTDRSATGTKPSVPETHVAEPTEIIDEATATDQHHASQGATYQGPSVVSYLLDGRSAIYMPVPAYKCRGGGDVTILIEVNKLGYVTDVEIDKKASSRDNCLQEAAKQAATRARFTTSPVGASSQKGNIVYRFVPQNR